MTDLTMQHKAARSLILNLREGLEQLEKAEQNCDQSRTARLSKDLRSKLADLQRLSTEMDSIWRMQSLSNNPGKLQIWKRKVEQVSEEEQSLRQALERHRQRQHRRQVEDAERQELMQRDVEGRSWQSQLDEDTRVQGHVQNSKRMLEDMFQSGTDVLVNMSGQRERLKAAHRKMLDALNSVGLSDSLLRVIERRQRLDKWLVYGGMVLVTIFVGLVFWWRR